MRTRWHPCRRPCRRHPRAYGGADDDQEEDRVSLRITQISVKTLAPSKYRHAGYASTLVDIFERAIEAIWRAHGERMAEPSHLRATARNQSIGRGRRTRQQRSLCDVTPSSTKHRQTDRDG